MEEGSQTKFYDYVNVRARIEDDGRTLEIDNGLLLDRITKRLKFIVEYFLLS